MCNEAIIYKVDNENCIYYFNSAWEKFARENECGYKCEHSYVHGKNFLEFIEDEETKMLYEYIIENVRHCKKQVHFPYRCDSPHERRYLEIVITPLENDGIEFKSCILKKEKRQEARLLNPNRATSEEFLTVCSMCKRIKIDKNTWLEVEDAVNVLHLFNTTKLPKLSHGLCPYCYNSMMEEIENLK